MAWDEEQLKALYANVYRREMKCPTCGGGLGLTRPRDGEADADAFGVVACRACDARHVVSPRNDPLRGTFRPYTEPEKRELFAADRARRTPVCPIDGTEMDVHLQRSLGRTSNAVIR